MNINGAKYGLRRAAFRVLSAMHSQHLYEAIVESELI